MVWYKRKTRQGLTDLSLIQLQLLTIRRQRFEHLHKLVQGAARLQRPPATTVARHRRSQGRRRAPGKRPLRGCFICTPIVMPPFPCHGRAALCAVFEGSIIISCFSYFPPRLFRGIEELDPVNTGQSRLPREASSRQGPGRTELILCPAHSFVRSLPCSRWPVGAPSPSSLNYLFFFFPPLSRTERPQSAKKANGNCVYYFPKSVRIPYKESDYVVDSLYIYVEKNGSRSECGAIST